MSNLFAATGLETAVLSRRVRLFGLGAVIGAALVVLAAAFAALAAFLALPALLAPWQAALSVGGAALVLGAIVFFVAMNALGRAVDQVQVAVTTNALVRAAPIAARFAVRSPRLIAALAAVLAAVVALIRAFGERPRPKPEP
jgi:glucan phosphoethanolaminetransferase (alkaline phosphatase superfamily)